MKDRILILGKGFIGSRISELLGYPTTSSKIWGLADALRLLKRRNCRILINCVGSTGERNVDDCEKTPQKTLFLNSFLPIILAEACFRLKVKLVHISSGCIFHFDYRKNQPLSEDSTPDFFELFYSRTKIYSEMALGSFLGIYPLLILRLRIPLDNKPHPKNILTKLIKVRRVIDIPNSITYIPDFALALKHLIKINATGIYNVVNRGGLRYPELMEFYKRYHPEFEYEVIEPKELKTVRTNLILSTKRLEATGFKARHIHKVLKECVEHYSQYL